MPRSLSVRPGLTARAQARCRCASLEPRVFLAASMVADINAVTPASGPRRFVDLGGTMMFVANDGAHGNEWWRSDGTAAGTRLVKDIFPENFFGVPNLANFPEPSLRPQAVVGGTVYFAGNDRTSGIELWKTDGTDAGTVMVKDLVPGTGSSSPSYFAVVGDAVYFSARNQVWKTDGTEAGTVQVTNSTFTEPPVPLAGVGDKLVFRANQSGLGPEPWVTDGTPAGTMLLKDIAPGGVGSVPGAAIYPASQSEMVDQFVVSGGRMYFAATPSGSKVQLWQTDGTPEGTLPVSDTSPDAVPGTRLVPPGNMIDYGGTVYVLGQPTTTNSFGAVYRVLPDGAGVARVALLPRNVLGWSLNTVGGKLMVLGRSTVDGVFSLYPLDPASPPPVLVPIRSFNSAPFSRSSPFLPLGDAAYFSLSNTQAYELWRTDGTAVGTTLVRRFARVEQDPDPPPPIAVAGGAIYFAPNDGTGREPWVSDGTPEGTHLLLDVNASSTASASPTAPVEVNGHRLFAATDGIHGRELWVTDGTAAGTRRMINPATGQGFSVTVESRLLAEGVGGNAFGTEWNGRLYFAAAAPNSGIELFTSDGTPGGTALLADLAPGTDSSVPKEFTPFKGRLYFTTADFITGARTVWSTDGTEAGTMQLKSLQGAGQTFATQFTPVGDTLYFVGKDGTTGQELWKTDGTPEGTVLVNDINPGVFDSEPSALTAYNGKAYFAAGPWRELWQSDGTEAGTVIVKRLYPGDKGPAATNLRVINGRLVFEALDPAFPWRPVLWASDGTAEGTQPLTTPQFSEGQGSRFHLVNAGGVGYFFRQRQGVAPEIWRTDGTPEGTRLVTTFLTAAPPPHAVPVGTNGSTVYVRLGELPIGPNPGGTSELWQSDGTPGGTRLLFSGPLAARPSNAVFQGGKVYFTASDGVHGNELWSVSPQAFRVVGRHVFYNGSAYDGNDPNPTPADDGAIAIDKTALLPGQGPGSFANVTSYAKGINGIIIDIAAGLPLTALAGLGGGVGLKVGDGGDPAAWADGPALTQLTIRPGAGVDGSDRLTLVWPDGAIKNTWLRVVVHAFPQLGFDQDDVFYFGNLVGEAGDDASALRVSALDLASVKRSLNAASTIAGTLDFNRDGRVNAVDLASVRRNLTRNLDGITPAAALTASPPRNLSTATATTLLDEENRVLR